MSAQPQDPWGEWKDGYRDGLNTSITVARTCAAEPGATAGDVLVLLELLADSQVISTGHGDALVVVSRLHPPEHPEQS